MRTGSIGAASALVRDGNAFRRELAFRGLLPPGCRWRSGGSHEPECPACRYEDVGILPRRVRPPRIGVGPLSAHPPNALTPVHVNALSWGQSWTRASLSTHVSAVRTSQLELSNSLSVSISSPPAQPSKSASTACMCGASMASNSRVGIFRCRLKPSAPERKPGAPVRRRSAPSISARVRNSPSPNQELSQGDVAPVSPAARVRNAVPPGRKRRPSAWAMVFQSWARHPDSISEDRIPALPFCFASPARPGRRRRRDHISRAASSQRGGLPRRQAALAQRNSWTTWISPTV